MTDLELVPTEDLLDELQARFDHMVFSGLKVKEGGEDVQNCCRLWLGNHYTCAGLAADIQAEVLAKLREETG